MRIGLWAPVITLSLGLGCAEVVTLCDDGFGEDSRGRCVRLDGFDAGRPDAGDTPPDAGEDAGGCAPACGSDEFCVDGACVDCRTNVDCDMANAGRCVNGTCEACIDGDGCEGVSDLPVCNAGTCVECMGRGDCGGGTPACVDNVCRVCAPETQDTDCGGNACDPVAFVCSTFTLNHQVSCEPCVSDDDCEAGRVCVDTEVDLGDGPVPAGAFCLHDTVAMGELCPNGWYRQVTRDSRGGVGGVQTNRQVCLPRVDVSCDAVLRVNQTDCRAMGSDFCGLGGFCLSNGRCSHPCSPPGTANIQCLSQDCADAPDPMPDFCQ